MFKVRKLAKKIYKKVFPIIYVEHCSQTLYEVLLFAINIYNNERNDKNLKRINLCVDNLISIQRKDGGFDIGYDFYFGYYHYKGESTAPETLSIVALIKAFEITNDERTKSAIERGVRWILNNEEQVDKDRSYIPYGPYSTRDVVVYNGTSFAQAPVAMWAKITNDVALYGLSKRLNHYLLDKLEFNSLGGYIKYNDPHENTLPEDREKIDYYHLAQQAEMHYLSYMYTSDKAALELCKGFWKTIYTLYKVDVVIPYLNNNQFDNQVHLWGYSSCISALIDAFDYYGDEKYINAAYDIKNWIMSKAFVSHYFFPVVDNSGAPVDMNIYPRSDAWVIASIAKLKLYNPSMLKNLESKSILKCYEQIENNEFSGKENHATNLYRFKLMNVAKSILGK
ncbi:hypothetical protein VFMJ11_0164 [Aliivibrio fischeri MJ11]|uniref:Uncharacterized protein n=1 Tax=Aliivibrio fischeri (strain MJ11) TaxID=388396 RepID=B5FFU8_ALIFM|nr:hypothetical protein [Aliivibrio fischeri]ACH64938.1 hypothetical protein VFMJ11_0164 [Aliivibrio fischeri MJ11]